MGLTEDLLDGKEREREKDIEEKVKGGKECNYNIDVREFVTVMRVGMEHGRKA